MSTQQHEDKWFIENPDKGSGWPYWPVLPVKKNPIFEDGNCGVLLDTGNIMGKPVVKPVVYLTNLYVLDIKNCPKKEYESIDAMLADGWVVD